MIHLTDSIGESDAAPDADVLRLAVLGATRLLGRPITPRVRELASRFAEVWAAGSDFITMGPIMAELRLAPDEVLPEDTDRLARLIEAGRAADKEADA